MALFARFLLTGGFALAFLSLRRAGRSFTPVNERRGVLRPPGAVGEEAFLRRCIRCSRCADACEANCIVFFDPAHGDFHGTPRLIAERAACTLCLACGPACPTGAIKPLKRKEEARMGVAVVDKRLCVSHNGSGVCGACHTVCPLRNRAIRQDHRNAPVISSEHCVGCGLCEEACIVRENRAIRVTSDRHVIGDWAARWETG